MTKASMPPCRPQTWPCCRLQRSQRERALNVWDVEVSGLGAPWQRAARLVSSMPDLALLPERWEGAGPGRAPQPQGHTF